MYSLNDLDINITSSLLVSVLAVRLEVVCYYYHIQVPKTHTDKALHFLVKKKLCLINHKNQTSQKVLVL